MLGNSDWSGLFQESNLKLVEHYAQEKGSWCALSYCWGSILAYKTMTDNRESHMQGIKFSRLPKTLQDAIFITRYLRQQYIWIDCLCIIQDDKADWQREAAHMANIYSNSYLTISAARANDSSEGFLGDRTIKSTYPASVQDEEGSFQLYFWTFGTYDVNVSPCSAQSNDMDPLMEPLSTRAWTLQERLLPVRTLHFATNQMYWDCADMLQGENGKHLVDVDPDFRVDDIAKSVVPSSTSQRSWYQLIAAFSSRNITYASDYLPALSGTIAAIQERTGEICYAGLWKSHFLEGLLWRLEHPNDVTVWTKKKPRKLEVWRAPSWSFAAVEGNISYYYAGLTDYDTDYCAELEHCSVETVGENPLGELKGGFARIRGPVTAINLVENDGKEQENTAGLDCLLQLREQEFVEAKILFDFERDEHCEALMLTPHTGLAVALVDATKREYVRVGTIHVPEGSDSSLLSASQYPESTSIVLL
ncbi:HET-domain-containing protein [Melanomma pulvis-pyrius CBS 109.77]|uniref:HET-domain-containing protein n=1 Tax=Melanomma pulvis-pyrius CBS 109.77 TaxID=1314802 RepID=A0A6A6XRH4_9PLEO|nr:HET-domain-containing protein [Melanomma pulvis-pyrius CBS 109.77]